MRPADTAGVSVAAGAWRGLGIAALLLAAVLWFERHDLPGLLGALREAPAGLCIAALVHAPQILLTAWAWRLLITGGARPGLWFMARLRWFREAANALLPAGGLLGQMLAARVLIRRGVPADIAAATATVDLTAEALSQLLFTLTGLLLLAARGGAGDRTLAVGSSLAFGVAGVAALVLLQRGVPPRWTRIILRKLPGPRVRDLLGAVERVQRLVRQLHAQRGRVAGASALHGLAWALGALEIMGVLRLLGHSVSLADGLIVESLAQTLRSVGFALPGAIGAQEAGIVGACALVGVPLAPALVLALLRRARELLFGVSGLVVYRSLARA